MRFLKRLYLSRFLPRGRPYTFYDPADCPAVGAWPNFSAPPPASGSPVFTLVPNGDLFDPGQNVQIEVYVSEATNVFAQEVALDVTGGTSGGLSLIDITVDSNRTDYLFYGITAPLEAKDLPGQRIGSSLNAAGGGRHQDGADLPGDVYLSAGERGDGRIPH